MRAHILSALAALVIAAAPVAAKSPVEPPRRVALVIGNDAYRSITPLSNPRLDAGRLAGLLAANGFEVVSCDGRRPGCFDLTRAGLLDALETLERKALGAELALVFYAGHGMQLTNAPSNVLAPVDLEFDCADMSMKRAVALEAVFKAVAGARQRIVIVDACRNDPFRQCPRRGSAPVSFGTLTAPEAESFLLVSSTKPGQVALDGIEGEHSPFARALFDWLEKSPRLQFHQLLQLHVAKAVIEGTSRAGFTQVPETLTRGVAPDACLAGSGCAADDRAGALQAELERLRTERGRDQVAETYLALKEKGLSRQLSPEERRRELDELQRVVRELAAQADTRSEEALARMQAGDAEGAKALYTEVLAAREQEAAEIEKQAAVHATEKRREAAKAARSLAALEKLTNVARAAELYKKAASLDPADSQTWIDYGRSAVVAGLIGEARSAFEQGASRGREGADAQAHYRAMVGLAMVEIVQGNFPMARSFTEAAAAIAEPHAEADANDTSWQQRRSEVYELRGVLLTAAEDHAGALDAHQRSVAIDSRLAALDPGNADRQGRLASSHSQVGRTLQALGRLPDALQSFEATHATIERLAKAEPANAPRQFDLATSYQDIGDVLKAQGNLAAALKNYEAGHAIAERLATADPSHAIMQVNLARLNVSIGDVLRAQGNTAAALERYRAVTASAALLAKGDITILHTPLADTYRQIGEVQQARGNLAEALQSFKASLAIAEYLTKRNPNNDDWQQGLGIAHDRVGGVLRAQGNLIAAATSFKAALVAAQRAAKSGRNNTQSQENLRIAHNRLGEVQQAQGDLAGALASQQAALAVAQRVAKAEPTNATRHNNLHGAYSNVASVLNARGDRRGAVAGWRMALRAIEVYAASVEEAEIKHTGKPGEKTAGVLGEVAWHALFAREFKTALAASERAGALAPDLVWIRTNRAHALMLLGRTREARPLYLAHKGTKATMPHNKLWEQVVADDFAKLRKAGLAHPMMAQIERALGVAQRPAAKQPTGRRVGR